jgi:two-component system, chemotaxis family, response regulator Rcp1
VRAEQCSDSPIRDLLIVDDDPIQAYLFEKVLLDLGLEHRCFHAGGGSQALDFVRRKSPFEKAPRPELIILDLNMPDMDGCAVLRELKADGDLRRIPVIMFSATETDEEFARCYNENANACVRKPQDFEGIRQVVREIERFWFHTAIPAL